MNWNEFYKSTWLFKTHQELYDFLDENIYKNHYELICEIDHGTYITKGAMQRFRIYDYRFPNTQIIEIDDDLDLSCIISVYKLDRIRIK